MDPPSPQRSAEGPEPLHAIRQPRGVLRPATSRCARTDLAAGGFCRHERRSFFAHQLRRDIDLVQYTSAARLPAREKLHQGPRLSRPRELVRPSWTRRLGHCVVCAPQSETCARERFSLAVFREASKPSNLGGTMLRVSLRDVGRYTQVSVTEWHFQ